MVNFGRKQEQGVRGQVDTIVPKPSPEKLPISEKWKHRKESLDLLSGKSKKSFEKIRGAAQAELEEAKQSLRDMEKQKNDLSAKITREEAELKSTIEQLEALMKDAPKEVSPTIENSIGSQKQKGADQIKEKKGNIEALESQRAGLDATINDAKGKITSIEDGRREKINKKIENIENRFGYTKLKEAMEPLKVELAAFNESIKKSTAEVAYYKRILSVLKGKEDVNESLYKEKLENVEKELEQARANKALAEERMAEIKERISQIDTKTEKWKGVLSSEGINKKPVAETVATPGVSGGGGTPESAPTAEPAKPEEEMVKTLREKVANAKGADAIAEAAEELASWFKTQKEKGASSSSSTEKPAGTSPEAGKETIGLAERFNAAKSIEDIRKIVSGLDENKPPFSPENPKATVLLNISFLEEGKNLDLLRYIPAEMGLRKNVQRLLDEMGDENQEEKTEENPQEASPEQASVAVPEKQPAQESSKEKTEESKGKQIEGAFGAMGEAIKEGAKEKLLEYDERIRAILEDGIPLRIGDTIEQLTKDFRQLSGGVEWSKGFNTEQPPAAPTAPEKGENRTENLKKIQKVDARIRAIINGDPTRSEDDQKPDALDRLKKRFKSLTGGGSLTGGIEWTEGFNLAEYEKQKQGL